jgi:hypothetical protein
VLELRGLGAADETAATPEVDHYIAMWSQALNQALRTEQIPRWAGIAGVDEIKKGCCEWPFAKDLELLMKRIADEGVLCGVRCVLFGGRFD